MEGGAPVTLSVTLNSAPVADVNVTVTSIYCPRQYFVPASPSLIFSNVTYDTSQILQLYAIDDNVARGTSNCSLLVTASSEDVYFANVNRTVTITIFDDDSSGIIVNKGTLTALQSSGSQLVQLMINEGTSGQFDISLHNQPLFNAAVVFLTTSSRIIINSTIHFTPATWNVTQSVSVSVPHDGIVESAQWVFVTISLDTNDATYSQLSRDIGLLVIDTDIPQVFQVSPPLTNTTDRGGSAELHVILVLPISSSIDISILISSNNIATASPSFLIFDPSQLGQAQTVTITGVRDSVITGNRTYNVLFVGSGNVNSASVYLTGIDTDYAALNCSKQYLVVNETGKYLQQ